MPQRSVATNFTFEQQRQEINLLAADFWTHKTTTDTAAPTYLKHDGSNDFTGQTLAVPSAFTINSDGGGGTVTISGNLNVSGTTTTVNTTNLDVTDKNITIAKGNTSDATADGAGITIDSGTDITFNFVDAKDAWVSSIGLEGTDFLKAPYGQFTGSGTPSTGQGVEINAPDTSTGQISSYDRGSTAYRELRLKGSTVSLYTGTANALVGTFNNNGLSMESGKTITGVLATAAQPNITSLGTLTGLTVAGQVQINGVDDQDNLIVKGGSTSLAVHSDDTDGEVSLRAIDSSGNNYTKYMSFFTEGGSGPKERVRITNDGSVGIGTLVSTTSSANPLRKLDVIGNSILVRPNTVTTLDAAGNASAVNNSIIVRCPYGENAATVSNAGNRFGIQFTGANNTTDVTSLNWGDDPVKSASIYGVSEDDTAGYSRKVGLAFYTSNFDIAQAEALRITGAGDVVIGHTDANAKLHLASGTSTAVSNDTNPAFQIGGTTNYRLGMYTTSEAAIIANKNGDDGIIFHTKTGKLDGTFGEAVRIDSNGNVGVGTDNPSQPMTLKRESAGQASFGLRFEYSDTVGPTQTSSAILVGSDGVTFKNYNSGRKFIFETGNVEPEDDNSQNLGASGKRWANVYTGDMHLNNMNTGGNEVDGSEGHWTMQEGSDDLFLINRNTGKKYKFNLTEVS